MTPIPQEEIERYFVTQAAELMGRNWNLARRCNGPDFIVSEGKRQFGLEVTEVFAGPRNRHGSVLKRVEATEQQKINTFRREYEETVANIPLKVQLVGNTSPQHLSEVVHALREADLPSQEFGHDPVVIEIDKGPARLRVYVTRAISAMWFNVQSRVGWVNSDPLQRIVETVEGKAKKLKRYREVAGPDIRLLIYADRHFKSGMLIFDRPAVLDTRGFEFVYFLSHPDSVTAFEHTGDVRKFFS